MSKKTKGKNEMEQLDMFETSLEDKIIKKPVRLISFFSGIEAQLKALKFLGDKTDIPVESYKTCEWAYNSIVACNEIHNKDFTNYAEGLTREQLVEYLDGNISTDYNSPCDVRKKSLKWLQNCYNSCKANHNLMNIMKVHGKDLEIKDKDKYEYILTYSFPCQDLSLAGKRAGMSVSQAEGGTRSGLLWEVERILKELKELDQLPQILLLENVPQVHSSKNIADFEKWLKSLDELGYKSFYKDLNAKKFGIPQNRNRCFVISFLGEYGYNFPKEFELKLKLKDFLEKEVDEKFYLSDKMIKYISAENEKWTGNNDKSLINKSVASTINTGEGQRRCDASNYICPNLKENTNLKEIKEVFNLFEFGINGYNRRTGSVYCENGISPTLLARNQGDNGFVSNAYCEYGFVPKMFNPYNKQEIKDIAPTQLTNCGITTSSSTVLIKEDPKTCNENQTVNNNLHIRKLTPKECMRLMAFQDKDVDSLSLSNSAIYHCAGDSICVNVLIGIFANMFGVNAEQSIKQYISNIKNDIDKQ